MNVSHEELHALTNYSLDEWVARAQHVKENESIRVIKQWDERTARGLAILTIGDFVEPSPFAEVIHESGELLAVRRLQRMANS